MNNSKLTNYIDSILTFLLVICPLHCLASSFELEVNIVVLGLFTGMFVTVFAILTVTKKKQFDYALCLGIILVLFVLIVSLFKELLLSELQYTVSQIILQYAYYINGVRGVEISSRIVHSATALFVAVSAVLCGLFTAFIMRMRFLFPAVTLSIVITIPCFILVNTLPELFPLLVLFGTLLTLFISSQIHRINNVHSGIISLIVAVPVVLLIAGVLHFVPQEGYERSDWQDNLLNTIDKIRSNKSDEPTERLLNVVEKEVDLSKVGSQQKLGQKVMRVNTIYNGTLYLKGVAYANYNNSTWSILDESSVVRYPQGYNSFNMTQEENVDSIIMTISTFNDESVLYTPYFFEGFNVQSNDVYDVLVENTANSDKYDVYYSPFNVNDPLNHVSDFALKNSDAKADIDNFSIADNPDNADYRSFVYKNYLELPDDVEEEMKDLIKSEGLANLQQSEKVSAVQSYIMQSAIYSLDTDRVPKNKDIALWFLEESDTGYCVHFATSATVMLRAMGIPARYVTGYVAPVKAWSENIITTDNAHAWVEYFDEEIGWVPLEVTPPDFMSQIGETTPTEEAPTNPTSATESTTPTQSATKPQEATESETKAEDKDKKGDKQSGDNANIGSDTNSSVVVAVTIGALVLLAISALPIRRAILLRVRKRDFLTGENNDRAKCVYRYLLKVEKYTKLPIASEVEAIAQKARFGNGSISDEELEAILQFAQIKTELLATDDSRTKKLYYKFILALA